MHKRRWKGLLAILAPALLAGGLGRSDQDDSRPTVLALTVQPKNRLPEAPRMSDVTLSSRWERRGPEHYTIEALRTFHATRLDWIYNPSKELVDEVHAMGIPVSVAMTAGIARHHPNMWARGLDGEPLSFPWMAGWNAWQGCSNNPEYMDHLIREMKKALDHGADSFQTDGICVNSGLARHTTACFCGHCMAGFRGFLGQQTSREQRDEWGIEDLEAFDYRDWLIRRGGERSGPQDLYEHYLAFHRQADIQGYLRVRREMDAHAGRRVVFSGNNGSYQRWGPKPIDYAIGEMMVATAFPLHLFDSARRARELGKVQIINMPKYPEGTPEEEVLALTRRVIGTGYALGMPVMVPWDVWIRGSVRYFGRPEDYAHFFSFVREHAGLFDEYVHAFGQGYDSRRGQWLPETAAPIHPPVLLETPDVYAFVRAKAGDPEAPVAVHLVDWRDEPAPFRLTLNPLRFFGTRPLRLTLLRPGKEPVRLGEGRIGSAEIPALEPWGILVVEPGAGDGEPWPPVFVSPALPRATNRSPIVLASTEPGAIVRYTLDGTEPTETSARYTGPIPLEEPAVVQARAFAGGRRSSVTRIGFSHERIYAIDTENPPPPPDVYLSDLEPAERRAIRWDGEEGVDRSLAGGALSIGGRVLAKGLSVHAHSELFYEAQPDWKEFVATVGLDDAAGPLGSVRFAVYADNRLLYRTPVIRSRSLAVRRAREAGEIAEEDGLARHYLRIEIPGGTRRLRLVMDGADDGVTDDLGVWGEAGIRRGEVPSH